MRKSRKELKQSARQQLFDKYGTVIAAFVLVTTVSIILSWVFSLISPLGLSLSLFTASIPAILITAAAYLIIALLNSILKSGEYVLYLNIARGKEYNVTDVFYGFTHQPDQVILVQLRILLVCLPAIIVYLLLVTLAEYLFYGNLVLYILSMAVFFIVFLCVILIIALRYELVFYLKADHPEYSAADLTRESRRLMTGNRLRYFLLELSFVGLLLLSLLSLGIGLLWVEPYMNMTRAFFYLDLTEGDQPAG